MNRKKISKAAMRRSAAAARQHYVPRDLPAEFEQMLDDYRPQSVDAVTYEAIRPTVIEVMRRSLTTGKEKFRQQRGYITQLAAWSHGRGLSLEIEALLTVGRISDFVNLGCRNVTEATRADKRSDLLELARHVNPAYDGLQKTKPIGRPRIKPPYPPGEIANIIRVARNQNTAGRRRQMCICVGLGVGAGLDSTDIKHVRRTHVDDRGDRGIWVSVGGGRPRIVPVRHEYEQLVREGLTGLAPNDLVIGKKEDRRDVAGRVFAEAVIPSTCPRIEQSRLRATYLAALIQQPIPILDVLDVAGIKGVQTLVDIAKHLREQEADR